MSVPLLVGVACSGAPDHRQRTWAVSRERCVLWREGDRFHAAQPPIPGDAPVLAVEPHAGIALLADGDVWKLNTYMGSERWSDLERGGSMMKASGGALIAAGTGCGTVWLATADRCVWSWTASGRAALGGVPVPGSAPIVALDLPARVAVLDDGSRFALRGGGWVAMPNLLNASGVVRVRCLQGFCIAAGRDLAPGDVLELPEGEALGYVASGRVELVGGA